MNLKIERVSSTSAISRVSQQISSSYEPMVKASFNEGSSRPSMINPKRVQEITQKKDMEWVLAFISDLTKLSDKEFSDPMLNYINN